MRPRAATLLPALLLASAGCGDPASLLSSPSAPARATSPEAGTVVEGSHTGPAGTRAYRLYVPSTYRGAAPVPLVVMLHGCTQTAADFAAGTRMHVHAEPHEALVVYPEQPPEANANRCWNWFEPAHQARDAGEPSLVAGITRDVMQRYKVDRKRVYVAGMSAGGALAVILGATYPDLFAAIGSHSGLEFRAAEDLLGGVAAMQAGGPDPDVQGALALRAMGPYARTVPAVVFHGALDATVNVVNGHQTLAQWAQTDDLADGADDGSVDAAPEGEEAGVTGAGFHFTRWSYHGADGRVLLEKWIVDELTHRWSGGSADGSYTEPRGPDASAEMLRFFLSHRMPGDDDA